MFFFFWKGEFGFGGGGKILEGSWNNYGMWYEWVNGWECEELGIYDKVRVFISMDIFGILLLFLVRERET